MDLFSRVKTKLFGSEDARMEEVEIEVANIKKYKVVAGVIRNTGSGWTFLEDANHIKLNCDHVTNDISIITIDFTSIAAKKVISFIVTPDETYDIAGYSTGVSVGLANAIISIAMEPVQVGGYITCNGSEFACANSNGIGTLTWASNKLKIEHTDLGSSDQVNQCPIIMPRYGKFVPAFATLAKDYTEVEFYDFTGTKITSLSSDLNFAFSRGPSHKKSVNPNTLTDAIGNFWFLGIFEV